MFIYRLTQTGLVLTCWSTLEEARDVLQLGDVVLPVVAVLGQQREVLQVLSAGVAWVQFVELSEHHPPRANLLLSELDARDRFSAGTENMIIQIKQEFSGTEGYDSRVPRGNVYPDIDVCLFKILCV